MSRKRRSNEIKCRCGKALTQGYAREMGECVTCCLRRLRRRCGRGLFLGSGPSRVDRREYYRLYRIRRESQEEAPA